MAATPDGLVEEAFAELARRWLPIFDRYAEYSGDIGFELHPGKDLFDGATWKAFLDRVNGHKSAMINYDPSHFLLQQMDYLAFSDLYQDRIKAFHVKDAEFNPMADRGLLRLPEQDRSNWTFPLFGRRSGRFCGDLHKTDSIWL